MIPADEECVARAICARTGDDPDRVVRHASLDTIRNLGIPGRTGAAVVRFITFPAWHRHRIAARAALAAMKNL